MRKDKKHVSKCEAKCGDKKRLMIVRVGSDERPAGQKDIETTQAQMEVVLANAGINDVELYVTHHAFEVDTYSLDKNAVPTVPFQPPKYKSLIVVQSPASSDKEAKAMQADISRILAAAGSDSVVYVTKHNVATSQFQVEVK